MKRAFGVDLKPAEDGDVLEGRDLGIRVCFVKEDKGWVGSVTYGGELFVNELIGSASPEACYRSLRGRVKNLQIDTGKLLERR